MRGNQERGHRADEGGTRNPQERRFTGRGGEGNKLISRPSSISSPFPIETMGPFSRTNSEILSPLGKGPHICRQEKGKVRFPGKRSQWWRQDSPSFFEMAWIWIFVNIGFPVRHIGGGEGRGTHSSPVLSPLEKRPPISIKRTDGAALTSSSTSPSPGDGVGTSIIFWRVGTGQDRDFHSFHLYRTDGTGTPIPFLSEGRNGNKRPRWSPFLSLPRERDCESWVINIKFKKMLSL